MNNKIMIFLIDAKMVIFCPDLNLNKVGIQVIYCNQIKAVCGRPTRGTTWNSEKLKAVPLRSGRRHRSVFL